MPLTSKSTITIEVIYSISGLIFKSMQPSTRSLLDQYLRPHPGPSSQSLTLIRSDSSYPLILANILSCMDPGSCLTLDRDYVGMKYCEMMGRENEGKVEAAVGVLRELEMKLDCIAEAMLEKNQWIQGRIEQMVGGRELAVEDSEILDNQNRKLRRQEGAYSGADRGKTDGQDKKLRQLLERYRCEATGFPKNKNEAARLLSNLEVQIQNLQAQKLSL